MPIFKYVYADIYGNEYATEVVFDYCDGVPHDYKDLWMYGVEQAWSDDVVRAVRAEYGVQGYLILNVVECIAS